MDSLDQQDSGGAQQTRLSGFFRNVRSKFSELGSKRDSKGEDVVITSQVVRKKPLLVIGNFTENVAPPEAGSLATTPPLPAPLWSSVNEVDSKKGITIIQPTPTSQQDCTLSKPASENTTPEQPNAGAGAKRKATDSEDVMNKRVDARTREVLFPTSCSDAFPRREPEETVKAKVSVKRVTFEQDSDWVYEPSTVAPVPDSLKEDVIVQQNRNRVQAPPSGSSVLRSDSGSQDGPLCQNEVDVDVGKIAEFSNSADEIDSEKCTTSGRRQRKEVFLGENWCLPVDLKGDLFSSKLKEILCKPFDSKESSEMWELATRRKPVLKLRQTRGRTMHVPSKNEGLSYLDHHPDLAQRIKESSHPAEKLALLRSFFFWLQHSCMEGAYKPWAPGTKNCTQEGDCVLTDGLDCEVLAVVLPLDEKKEVSTVVKPLEPAIVDLSDDDEDDCCEVIVKTPVKTVPTCICCCKEFGMEKDQQRALYRTCGHIDTCMKCVDRLWMVGKQRCLRCGVIQSMKPGSLFEFACSSE